MPIIRQLSISHFRSISQLMIYPHPGLNCLIGPGDSGKSTILEAIDWVLGARRSLRVSDCDFHKNDLSKNIFIEATVSAPEDVMSLDRYGHFIRGYNLQTGAINDEPLQGDLPVLTIQLRVGSDLEPEWRLYSIRAEQLDIEKDLQWKHKEIIAPIK